MIRRAENKNAITIGVIFGDDFVNLFHERASSVNEPITFCVYFVVYRPTRSVRAHDNSSVLVVYFRNRTDAFDALFRKFFKHPLVKDYIAVSIGMLASVLFGGFDRAFYSETKPSVFPENDFHYIPFNARFIALPACFASFLYCFNCALRFFAAFFSSFQRLFAT